MAAAVMSAPFLAPRPPPWEMSQHFLMRDGKENRPALKQLQQSAPAARARRERPCDSCRRRKSKCVLQDSRRCVLCEFHQQDCTFVEDPQPRKRKADDGNGESRKSSVSGPSTTPLKKKVTTNDAAAPPPSHSPRRHRSPPTAQTAVSQSRPVPAASPPSTFRTPAAIPPALAIDESLSLQRHHYCEYMGQTTALDASLVNLSSFNSHHESHSLAGPIRQVTHAEYFKTHADSDVPIPDDEVRALAEIEAVVGPHGPALIDLYFRHIHPSYPIIQKQMFLHRHHYGDRQFNPPLLAAMYLLALAWWKTDPSLIAAHHQPDVARLEFLALTSLSMAMQRPKLSVLQAGLLLQQYSHSSPWSTTVQLVALGQDIGLHLDCTNWSIPLWERKLRKRLSWALYVQDKWAALVHGRPSHINAVDWAVPPLTEEDLDEEPSSSSSEDNTTVDPQLHKGRMLFMQLISLTDIMAEVCGTFYSQSAIDELQRAGRLATQLVLNRAKPVQIRLKDWFARLPADCKVDAGMTASSYHTAESFSSGTTMATASLHLAYFATEITIHRRIVQSLVPSLSNPDTTTTNSTIDPYMLYICRSAAKTRLISAMDFVNRLTPAHLQAFWFFGSASNLAVIGAFGALLQATSPAAEEAEFYAARLREFRWTLGVSAVHAEWIDRSIDLVEASGEMLEGLKEKPRLGEEERRPRIPPSVQRQQREAVKRDLEDEDMDDDDEEDDEEDDEMDEVEDEEMDEDDDDDDDNDDHDKY